MNRLVLKGNEHAPLGDARSTGKADPNERLEVTVLLRRSGVDELNERLGRLHARDKIVAHLSRAEFARRHGAAQDDLAAVRRFARDHGLAVVHEDPAARSVILAGTVARLNEAFGVVLEYYEHPPARTVAALARSRCRKTSRPPSRPYSGSTIVRLCARSCVRGTRQPDRRCRREHSILPNWPRSISSRPMRAQARPSASSNWAAAFAPAIEGYFAEVGVAAARVTAVSVDHAKNRPIGQTSGHHAHQQRPQPRRRLCESDALPGRRRPARHHQR
jgi:kumamolisin